MKHLQETLFALAITLASCQGMESETWDKNGCLSLDWKVSNPETDMRPIESDTLLAYFYPKNENMEVICKEFKKSYSEYDIPGGIYDVLIVSSDNYICRTGQYKAICVTLPVHRNDRDEREISENPKKMIYVGKIPDLKIDYERQISQTITMEKLYRNLTVDVVIADTAEITKPCIIDISGMRWQMKLGNGTEETGSEAVQVFTIHKKSRSYTKECCYSYFTGNALTLGPCGRNIMDFTYTNAAGQTKTITYDITTWMMEWNNGDRKLTMSVHADTNLLYITDWGEYNPVDVDFAY